MLRQQTQSDGPVPIVVRTLGLPERFEDLAVRDVRFSRSVVGTDRPLRIEVVVVANLGARPHAAEGVELTVEGKTLTAVAEPIAPGAEASVFFEYRFTRTGQHIVEARLRRKDDLAGDDRANASSASERRSPSCSWTDRASAARWKARRATCRSPWRRPRWTSPTSPARRC